MARQPQWGASVTVTTPPLGGARLGVHRQRAVEVLDAREQRLWAFARAELANEATFEDDSPRFHYRGEVGSGGTYHLDWREAKARGDIFFRLESALAQAALARAMGRRLPVAEVVFDYEAHGARVTVLEERRGSRGWLRVERLAVRSVEDEEHLLVGAVSDAGEELDADWCDRLLGLPVLRIGAVHDRAAPALPVALERQHARVLAEAEARHAAWLGEEEDKLDQWAEDLKLGLERELKDLDAEVRAARKASRLTVTLAEKLAAQRHVKQLEQRT